MPFQNNILAGASGASTYTPFYEPWIEGDMYGWGVNNPSGKYNVGDGTQINRSSPVHIGTSDSDWLISHFIGNRGAGGIGMWAHQSDGSLWNWGSGATNLQAEGLNSQPSQVDTSKINGAPSTTGWISKDGDNKVGNVSTYIDTFCAIRADGTLWTGGQNSYGQLGNGSNIARSSATQIGSDLWYRVACGHGATYAIRQDGTLWSWGRNNYGQLGVGDTIVRSSPVQIGTETDWVNISPGDMTNNALRSDGTLWGWGAGVDGQHGLGDIINRSSPVQIGTDTDWVAGGMAGSGRKFTGAVKNGELWMWGLGTEGNLGLGTDKTDKRVPTQIGTLTNWKYLSVGVLMSGAVKTDGTLWTWGNDSSSGFGALGDGTASNTGRSSPAQVGTETDWLNVMCYGANMFGIRSP